jgi:hypothetical protein
MKEASDEQDRDASQRLVVFLYTAFSVRHDPRFSFFGLPAVAVFHRRTGCSLGR